jgi:N-acetylmuramoyl-L-alanine amidase
MIYLVAGHSVVDSGAIGIGGNNESVMTRALRNLILGYMKRKDVSIDDDTLNTSDVVRWLRNRVKANDIVIDLHFNSHTTDSANGTECFANKTALPLGKEINSAIVRVLGTRDRGMKDASDSARGKIGVLTLPSKVVLVEVCFISNKSDYDKYIANADKLARELALILDRA